MGGLALLPSNNFMFKSTIPHGACSSAWFAVSTDNGDTHETIHSHFKPVRKFELELRALQP